MTAEVERETVPPLPPVPEAKGIYEGKFTDRNPNIRAAGKWTFNSNENVPQCLTTPDRPASPAVIRRFRNCYRPDHGQARVFYGVANDPHLRWAKEMTHGVQSFGGSTAAEVLNPPLRTIFQERFLDRMEAVYASKHHRLGQVPDPKERLPPGMDIYSTTFGIKTEKIGSAGELVNPDRTPKEIFNQEKADHDTYLVSHRHSHPGEQLSRGYEKKFDSTACFGNPTPHRNDGIFTRKTLRWLGDELAQKRTPLVSKRLDDFRERTQPQLGRTLDPIKDTMKVPEDHTFGILQRPDPYGVDDLIHGRAPRFYLRGLDRERGMLAAVRQQMKKFNYQHYPTLESAFKGADPEGKGKLNKDDVRRLCEQFQIPIDVEILEQLLDYCDVDQNGLINYVEFCNFLNWRDKFPQDVLRKAATQSAPASGEILSNGTPVRVKKQIDDALHRWTTSNGAYNEGAHRVDSRSMRCYGIPTVRSDLPIPRFRRVGDRTTYGNEGEVGSVMSPSIFGSHGIHEYDMMCPRTKEELKSIFQAINIEMTSDTLDQIYAKAAEMHPRGEVGIEAFRAVLDTYQAEHLKAAIAEQNRKTLTATMA